MQRFQRVLVCLDDEDHAELASERGAVLAIRAGASLKIVHVSDPGASSGVLGWMGGARARGPRRLRQQLAWVETPLRGWSVPVALQVSDGPPGLAIAREVLAGDHDAVVHVERGEARGRLRGWLARRFRSTTVVQLARLCPCPLWVVPAPGGTACEHLLAAVSLHPWQRGLDREIVDTALAMARLLGRTLHLVHGWDAPGIHLLALRSCPEDLAVYRRAVRQERQDLLESLARQYGAAIPRERLHLRQGRPGDVILGVAAELGADPIVMGTVARRGLAGLLAGNTAERVVRRTERSILIVKPPGFVSPATARPARARVLAPAEVAVLS